MPWALQQQVDPLSWWQRVPSSPDIGNRLFLPQPGHLGELDQQRMVLFTIVSGKLQWNFMCSTTNELLKIYFTWRQHTPEQCLAESQETQMLHDYRSTPFQEGNIPCEVVKTEDPLPETAIPVTALFKTKVLQITINHVLGHPSLSSPWFNFNKFL